MAHSVPRSHIAPLAFACVALAGCPDEPVFIGDADCDYGGAMDPALALTVAVHYRSFGSGQLVEYEVARDEVDWLAAWASRHGLVLELALNGYQAEGALAAGEEGRYADLHTAGHGFGVHHHPTVYQAPLSWGDLPQDPTDDQLQQSVDDHRQWIGSVLDPEGIPYHGGHVRLTGRSEWWHGMMDEAGYTTETLDASVRAATAGAEAELAFDLLRPFRWEVGGAEGTLHADGSVPFVVIPQHPQIGALGMGDHLRFDGSVEHLQTLLLLAYLEWRAGALAGGGSPPQAFGVTVHPELGARHNSDLERFGTFVHDLFLDPADGEPARSVCGVSRERILANVEAWEADHPDVAPFDFEPGDPYPYRLPQLAAVYETHLVAVHDDRIQRGLRVAELQQMLDPGDGDLDDLVPGDGWLLVWGAAGGGDDTADLRTWTGSDVTRLTSAGEDGPWPADAVPVGPEPFAVRLP